MTHTKVIRRIMKETRTRQIDLAERLGTKSRQVISERINHSNIGMKTMLELLEAMGYEVVVRKSLGSYKDGEYLIRLEDYKK